MNRFDVNKGLPDHIGKGNNPERTPDVHDKKVDIDGLINLLESIPPDTDKVKLAQYLDPILTKLACSVPIHIVSPLLNSMLGKRFGLTQKEIAVYKTALKQKQDQLRKTNRQKVIRATDAISRQTDKIIEKDHCYLRLSTNKDGIETATPISSFVIRPKARIDLDGYEAIQCDFVTAKSAFRDIIIERHHWHNRNLFLKTFSSVDLFWLGNDNEVQLVQRIISRKDIPKMIGTRTLGQNNNIWVLPGAAISRDGWIDNPNIIFIPRGRKSMMEEKLIYRRLPEQDYSRLMHDVYSHILSLNTLHVMVPLIGWFFATPLKCQIKDKLGHFPILNLWGTKGGGKSSLLKLLWRMFGVESELFSCTETEFAMLCLFSSTTSIPVVFDEYKPWDIKQESLNRFTRILRRSYDGEVEFRGKPDLTLEPFPISAPVVVAGEVPISEGALLERIIPVNPSPNWLQSNPDTTKAFANLRKLPLNGFIDRYVQYCLAVDFAKEFEKAKVVTSELVGQKGLPGRVIDNILTVVIGFMQFEAYGRRWNQQIPDSNSIDISKPVDTLIDHICRPYGAPRTVLDDFIENLAIMAETGRLKNGMHYIIRPNDKTIALRFDACLAEFRRYAKETHFQTEVLDKKAYWQQLKENKSNNGYIMDINIPVRFPSDNIKRAVLIDPDRSEKNGFDLSGFYS